MGEGGREGGPHASGQFVMEEGRGDVVRKER